MPAIKNIPYKGSIKTIKDWVYGRNWPAVYVIYNDKNAYVGETLDLVRRTEQHLADKDFDKFTDICLISDMSFNKSVILDLESYLIKYVSADGTKRLTNGNAGIVDHNYFYREAYEEEFAEIWDGLLQKGIVSKSIADIQNSELFKYSPYKALSEDQQKTAVDILKNLVNENKASQQTMIEVNGGAGTGKTILAVYLIKLIHDIITNKNPWVTFDDEDLSYSIRSFSKKLLGIKKIGLVVPMSELRTTIKSVFNSIEGLSEKMVLSPEQVVEDYYDLLVVDESHRLYQRKNLPGQQLYAKFDRINERKMGHEFKGDVSDNTELDWIIKSSRMQIIFYDKNQTIRATDISIDRFDNICRPHLYKCYELISQMRCKGGNGYYEYVKKVLESRGLSIKERKHIDNYTTKVVDDITDLFEEINDDDEKEGLSEVIAGPGWSKNEDIVIQGHTYHWAGEKHHDRDVIYSIHKSQGFDLNYAGVIFGKEIYYDTDKKEIEINKKELRDNFTKSAGDDAMRQYLLNIYLTLMTRGIKGTYVFAVDDSLRDYLRLFLD